MVLVGMNSGGRVESRHFPKLRSINGVNECELLEVHVWPLSAHP